MTTVLYDVSIIHFLFVSDYKVHVSKNYVYCEKTDVLQFYSVAKHSRDGTNGGIPIPSSRASANQIAGKSLYIALVGL